MIKAQDAHLKDVGASGDETHKMALKEMGGRWQDPTAEAGWYEKAKDDFAALPDDRAE